jgi:predicted dehydrogenase
VTGSASGILSDPIRWGILGAGSIAATVGADIAASPGCTLAAVGARDLARAEAFAATNGVARAYGSYAELVADPEVDVVYIATTHGQHHEHALLALEAGKPVLVEKAFALNARQAREIVATARERRLFCMEAMWMRFNPLVRRAQQVVASGAIGEVVGLRAELCSRFEFDARHRLFDLAAGGGALLDLGVYPITFAWLILGAPEHVDAIGTLSPTGSDASVSIQCGYRDGALGQIFTSAVTHSPAAGMICGTKGTVEIGPRIQRATSLTVTTEPGEEFTTTPITGNGYGLQVAEVARCLRQGELESPVVPLDETVAILEMIDDVRKRIGVRYPADGS